MANPLILFPARAAIGQADSAGRVMQTPEFARALADLLIRLGGTDGASITDIMKDLGRRPSTLAQSSSPVNVSGTTEARVLASVNVPANSMGEHGMVRVTTTWSMSNNENNKTVITRFGGEEIARNPVITVSTYQEQRMIQNRGVKRQVFIFGGNSYTGAPIGMLEKDTTKVQKVDIVAQLENASDSMTLEAYTVELIPTV